MKPGTTIAGATISDVAFNRAPRHVAPGDFEDGRQAEQQPVPAEQGNSQTEFPNREDAREGPAAPVVDHDDFPGRDFTQRRRVRPRLDPVQPVQPLRAGRSPSAGRAIRVDVQAKPQDVALPTFHEPSSIGHRHIACRVDMPTDPELESTTGSARKATSTAGS